LFDAPCCPHKHACPEFRLEPRNLLAVLIEFAKDAVFSKDAALAVRYGAERTGLGGAY
jgi:hypothetical protein